MPTSIRRPRSRRVSPAVPSKPQDSRSLVQRILDVPHLAQVVPRLAPELLHQVIARCGLDACGELLALATPAQLASVADLDLWRPMRPGLDDTFDASRFGAWLEALLECDAPVAARTVTGLEADLVTAGLAHHVRVFDAATVAPYITTDGTLVTGTRDLGTEGAIELCGYEIVARGADPLWDAIVDVLRALADEHGEYFHRVMRGCRALSNAGREPDGLDHLLPVGDQALLELASAREQRRDQRGFLPPADARAFLQAARQVRLDLDSAPSLDPIAHAFFRSAGETPAIADTGHDALAPSAADDAAAEGEAVAAVAAVTAVLVESGVLAGPPRALLASPPAGAPRPHRIHEHLQHVLEHDPLAHSLRSEELGYLANALLAGCSIQSRPFTPPEARDAAIAVCNLGLENWPARWRSPDARGGCAVEQNLVAVFQVGWTVLHDEVCLPSAGQLIEALKGVRVVDRDTQRALDALRRALTRQWRAGTPWKARDALDVIATLDMTAWAALLGLIDEYPVIPAALVASLARSPHAVSPSAFEFISDNVQIASVHAFLQSLPAALGP